MTRGPIISHELSTKWAELVHVYAIDALMSTTAWTNKDVAFHGGTSLHLSWNSPRYSEDLDFLLAHQLFKDDKDGKDEFLNDVMRGVQKRIQEKFIVIDPAIKIEARYKTKDAGRMSVYNIVVTHPKMSGKVMAKVEFWRVDSAYLLKYPTTFKTPIVTGDIVSIVTHAVPAATLETAICDKFTAFATRPYLKWRDIYDMWWIGTQTKTPVDTEKLVEQFLHNITAYNTSGGKTPSEIFREFLAKDVDAIIALADPDLKKWLPPTIWAGYLPDGPSKMVHYVRNRLMEMADLLDALEMSDSAETKMKP
jgi:predicted nucleotidyltransferase component of viral defense system